MGIKTISYLKLIAVVILWSSIYHIAKYLVKTSDVSTIAFVRFFITSITLLILYHKRTGDIYGNLRKILHNWVIIFLIGFFGIFIYTLSFFSAEKYIPAEEIAIIYASAPAITTILGCFMLKQKINFLGWIGLIIALMGTIAVLSLASNNCGTVFCFAVFKHASVGQILALIAAISLSFYNILSKKATMQKMDSKTINTFSTSAITVILFINFLAFHPGNIMQALDQPYYFWIAIMYVSIFGTVIGYQWYMDAIQQIEVSKVTVFQNAVPFCTVLLGILINGKTISGQEVLAGLAIVIGVLITNFSKVKTRL